MAQEPGKTHARPTPVAGIVEGLIGSLGLSGRYYGWLIVSHWAEIVGEYYARHSRAFKFEDGTLYVAVTEDGWRQQIALDNNKILAIIHARPHGRVVRDLRLVRGEKGIHSNGN
jgi:hypothetical protein